MEKFPIYRKISSTANIPSHQILEEKFSFFKLENFLGVAVEAEVEVEVEVEVDAEV